MLWIAPQISKREKGVSLNSRLMEKDEPQRSRLLFWLALAIVTLAFAFSVQLRRPAFARPLSYYYEWLTASTIKYTTSWLQDGPWAVRFAMLEYPKAVDRESIDQRTVYASYPPGQVFPIYFLSLMRGQYPGPALVETWNLFTHFITVLACFLLVYLMLQSIGPYASCLLAAVAGLIQIFITPALWFQQNVYGPDTAVILPFALFVLFLFIARLHRPGWFIVLALFFISFYGCLTDWFFVVVAGVICAYYLFALIRKRPNSGRIFLAVALGSALAMIFFLWQLMELDAFGQLISTYGRRTSSKLVLETTGMSTARGIRLNFVTLYGRAFCWWSIFVILFPLFLLPWRKLRQYLFGLESDYCFSLGIILLPCLLHTALLPQHAAIHNFSVLKYTIPITVLTVLLFAWLWEALWRLSKSALIFICVGLLLCLGAVMILPVWLDLYGGIAGYCTERDIRKGLAVRFTLGPDEVAVSPDFEIVANPPQALAYSLRSVYGVEGWNAIEDISRRTGCKRIRVYFFNRDGLDLWRVQEQFHLLTKPKPVREFPRYSSALVNPDELDAEDEKR